MMINRGFPWSRTYWNENTGDGGDSGGGGDGGGTGTSSGDEGNAGNEGGSGSNGGAGGQNEAQWYDALPEGMRDHADVTRYKSVEALAQGHIHANKLLGAKSSGINVPAPDAPTEDWDKFYESIGRPESPDKYGLSPIIGEGDEQYELPEDWVTEFAAEAHKHGMTAKQTQDMFSWFFENARESNKKVMSELAERSASVTASLQKEWGDEYKSKMTRVGSLISKFADEDAKSALQGAVGNSPEFMRMMANIADSLSEDSIDTGEGKGDIGGLSPNAARSKLSAIMSDSKHPYYDGAHAGHQAAVEEVTLLNRAIYGNDVVGTVGGHAATQAQSH